MMMMSPNRALIVVFAMLVVGASLWRRRRIRRAVRDLPTLAQRLLGPDPEFAPPPPEERPASLNAYAAMHKRSQWIVWVCWAIAVAYATLILALMLKDGQI